MKYIFLMVLCGAAIQVSESGKPHRSRRPQPSNADSSQVTWRQTALQNRLFAYRLYANVARKHLDGNLMISPYVLSSALSMTLLGAKGQTEQEIMQTLGYSSIGMKKHGAPYTKYDVPKLYQSLLEKSQQAADLGGNQFIVANKLYGDQSETFLPQFKADTEQYYNARFEEVDFAGDPAGSRALMNDWISNKTLGVITDAVTPDMVSSSTLLTLVSTAYFKGEWENKFDSDLTYTGTFTKRDGTTVNAQFMKKKYRFKLGSWRRLQCTVLTLPYKNLYQGYEVEMQLFLPRNPQMLVVIEQQREHDFHQALRKMNYAKMELHFPKFRMEFKDDLVGNLEELGIRTLFGPLADLSGMNGKRNLYLNSAVQKTFIEVNEEGTTAAAVQVIGMTRSFGYPVLRFDHPFLFMIVEKTTKSILFMGRVEEPM